MPAYIEAQLIYGTLSHMETNGAPKCAEISVIFEIAERVTADGMVPNRSI